MNKPPTETPELASDATSFDAASVETAPATEVSPFDALAQNAPADGEIAIEEAPADIASNSVETPVAETPIAEAPAPEAPLFTEPYVEPRGSRWPLIIFLLLLIGGGAGGYFYVQKKIAAREARRWAPIVMPERFAVVPTDWGVATLGARLQKAGKIRDESAFLEAAKAVNLTAVTPGGYLLPATAGPRDLARVFRAGPTHAKTVFPEGFTGLQIAARLKKEGFAGADKMENLIYPANEFSPYEGTLYPDTYYLPLRGDAKTLIAKMQEKFSEEVKTLPQPFPKVKGKPLTTRDIVTIASLIERETSSKTEMPLIAGVMLNRLNKPMRLQIDATIQYARLMADKDHKARLSFEDLKINSPFNTYQNDGLPPTPICNPGLDALRAAARPAQTDALFYVYSPRLKKHLFAQDFEGHKRNVAIARRERAAIEGETTP